MAIGTPLADDLAMSFGIGKKIALGFGGLLVILLAVGALSVARLDSYSRTLERIFHENYDSIRYAQAMRDALHGLKDTAAEASPRFVTQMDDALGQEVRNVTLPGEQDLASQLTAGWNDYKTATTADRRDDLVTRLDKLAAAVAELNLQNIVSVDGQVQRTAVQAKRTLYVLVGAGVLLAVLFTLLISRSILRPLRALTKSATEIGHGNLDLVVDIKGRDEVGQLAAAFNAMATKLREFRRTDRAKIIRTQQTTQLSVDSLPDAVALVSVGGHVELANKTAIRLFGLTPGAAINGAHAGKLVDLYRQARDSGQPVGPGGYDSVIQIFENGGVERFFLPRAIPIVDDGEAIGVTLVLGDVTNLRKIDEMKSGLLSVVSHELKTPLTSIRMATHLLLEERIGTLAPKQIELLVAARDDADRLNNIVKNLLDMARLESGRARLDLVAMPVERLLHDMAQSQQAAFRDKGVTLQIDASGSDDLQVMVDADRVEHVFSNLLGNALRFTPAGGSVTMTAAADTADASLVRFTVADTGPGIAADDLARVFERFYRAPGQKGASGAGLGLAITKDIIEAHGGTIDAHSPAGSGASIVFTLVRTGAMQS